MYGDSHALSSDSTIIFPSNIKQKEELASVKREKQLLFMESAANTHYSEFGQHFSCNSNSQSSSGLLRFRSAPTSLLANFTRGGEKGENLGSMFCSGEANNVHVMPESDDSNCKERAVNRVTDLNSQLPPQYPRHGGAQMEYRIELDQRGQGKIGSSLVRQNSSPEGLFSHLNSQNGYSGARGIGSCKIGNPSSSRFKNHMHTSSGLPSSLGMISRINEVENETMGPNGLDEGKVENGSCDGLFLSQEFTFSSWNDSSYFAENFTSGIKRELLDNDPQLFADTENREPVNRKTALSHHLSLPKTSIEMEKLMQFPDTVPCKVRAKRGCATHPRSIAERVRRTRISERMRKLQELVPNMDKQTNTADMLDLAVEYIKSLQKQYKALSGYRANCKCSAFQMVVSDQTH